jgi:transcriptional regulator with XRE-family HTH domain
MDPTASSFAADLRRLRQQNGLSLRELAARTHHGKSYLHELETGQKPPTLDVARRLDEALGGRGALTASCAPVVDSAPTDDGAELDALELSRRVSASDVSGETLDRLEHAADAMAMAYATTPPAELLPRVQRHLNYVASLIDARKTLDQHRRLLVVGGWLALLRATLHIDVRQDRAADAYLVTATALAGQAGDPEIAAWCLETRAWNALTGGDYRAAVDLSQQAQAVAPAGGSAIIQATAQEGRAWARLGDRKRTRQALDRVERFVSTMAMPDHPEHHYQYDPAKALSYAATTLSWVGDPAAEPLAREVIAQLESSARPRRVASARLDLGLALIAADKPDEAAAVAVDALESGSIVPSNWWRATELVSAVRRSGVPELDDLRDAYDAHKPSER